MGDPIRCCPECGAGQPCLHDSMRAWALAQLEAHVRRNLPAARASRSLRASLSQSRKDMVRARRSLASSQAASKRKLDHILADIERVARERREVQDREFEERRWDLIMRKK